MSDTSKDLETRIRDLAYALWEKDGRPEGRAEEYWERACRCTAEEDDATTPEMTAGPEPVAVSPHGSLSSRNMMGVGCVMAGGLILCVDLAL